VLVVCRCLLSVHGRSWGDGCEVDGWSVEALKAALDVAMLNLHAVKDAAEV